MSRTASGIRKNVALPSLVLVVGSWLGSYPWFCPVFVTGILHMEGALGQIPFGSYIHSAGRSELFRGL